MVLANIVPQYFEIEYSNTTKYRLTMCFYDWAHPRAFLVNKQCLKRHKQRVQTSTILDLCEVGKIKATLTCSGSDTTHKADTYRHLSWFNSTCES